MSSRSRRPVAGLWCSQHGGVDQEWGREVHQVGPVPEAGPLCHPGQDGVRDLHLRHGRLCRRPADRDGCGPPATETAGSHEQPRRLGLHEYPGRAEVAEHHGPADLELDPRP